MGELRAASLLFLLLTVVTGVAYPLVVTGLAQVLFPGRAGGSLIEIDGRTVGSELLGQAFAAPRYFWGRPSATPSHAYNGAVSGGTNLGSTNPALHAAIAERVAALHEADPANAAPIPVDLVTASASGLDPHLSPAAAEYQVARVARERGVRSGEIRKLVAQATSRRTFGIFGEPRVNVLALNLSLDASP